MFGLRRREQHRVLDALLLEEPENHLSHVNMKKLVNTLAPDRQMQLFVATHSSHIHRASILEVPFCWESGGQWISGTFPKIRHVFS
ncbi:ATP-binding protein [Pantoea stewartii]|uniref:ATP-binding protein n=1 Tax=Pantoea stewartii TaxID=66269 RepID=UPI001EEF9A26|nr:ATP-binding protein [Pantoea stewartii]